jgi:SAM-dependent methyltransferase
MGTIAVDEPLAESAPIARTLAAQHCEPGSPGHEGCAWYHGFWQYMRLLGLAKTSGGHVDFLVHSLVTAAREGSRRVLVSGTGDYSMPAHVLAVYAAERAPIELHVLDRCATPVALTRWYADRVGASITGHVTDILDFEGPRPYDVILTNSFLGYFDVPSRARLFARWRAMLRPGGMLLVTNRIRPGDGYDPVGFTAAQASALREAVCREAQRLRGMCACEPQELAALADAYTARFRSVPVRSSDEVVQLALAHGFRIGRLDTAAAAGRRQGDAVAGPTTAEAADYVRLAAVRA